MYNKRQELILDFIADNPSSQREDIEHFLIKIGEKATKITAFTTKRNRGIVYLQKRTVIKGSYIITLVYSLCVPTKRFQIQYHVL